MQRRRKLGGYTIIEVMIFLAVSGFMFVLAAYFIQGKQSGAQFIQAMNTVNTQVQQVISDVGDNNYVPANITCQPSGSTSPGASLSIPQAGSNTQGSNLGCVYLGKVIQFGIGDTGQDYNIYTVAGCQYTDCASGVTDLSTASSPSSFSDAEAQVVDPGNNNTCLGSSAAANLTTCNQLEWDLQVNAMYDDSSGTPVPTNSIGFFNSFTQNNGQGLVSGSQDVYVVNTDFSRIGITDPTNTEQNMVSELNNNLDNASTTENPDFVICFSYGSDHAAALTIGGTTSGRLSTSVQTNDNAIQPFNNSSDTCKA